MRVRAIANAVDLLRLVLAYCLGERGLRLTSAWAAAIGLADISMSGCSDACNVAKRGSLKVADAGGVAYAVPAVPAAPPSSEPLETEMAHDPPPKPPD